MGLYGERAGTRTPNLVIKSHLLYQLSYAPRCSNEEKLLGPLPAARRWPRFVFPRDHYCITPVGRCGTYPPNRQRFRNRAEWELRSGTETGVSDGRAG